MNYIRVNCILIICLIESAETDQNDVPEPGRTEVPEQPNEESARRDEKVPEGVWHGTTRKMVYAVQMEKSLHTICRLSGKRSIGVN